jgi:calcium binding protein 39
VDFLSKFHTDRSEDEQFNDEKAYLIKQIKEMKPLDDAKPSVAAAVAANDDEH